MGKKNKEKSGNIGKFFIAVILILMMGIGAFLGYSIAKNGGGLQGVLATVLGQDMEKLQDLDTIDILVLRN